MEWMEQLPDRQRDSLENLLDQVNKQEDVYMQADNASVGQIWVALAQMHEKMDKMDSMIKAQREVLKEFDSSIEVDEKLDQRLEESLRRY
jgi:CO dehydrogenase/acetyl-CoA synthase alpha subunit